MSEGHGSSEATGSASGSWRSLTRSLVRLVQGGILLTLLISAVPALLGLALSACFLFGVALLTEITTSWGKRSSPRSGDVHIENSKNSQTSITAGGSNTKMGWPFETYELIGGPWDGQTFTAFDTPPEELLPPLSPEGEFRRVGQYRLKDGAYHWVGEFVVRDVTHVTD